MIRRFAVASALALLSAAHAHAASFDCGHAVTASEKAICANQPLNVLDQRMSYKYFQLLALVGQSGQRDQFKTDQVYWLKNNRDKCGPDTICLRGVLNDRIQQLDGYIASVKNSQ